MIVDSTHSMGASGLIFQRPKSDSFEEARSASQLIAETWSLILDKDNLSPIFLYAKEVEELPFQTAQEWFVSVFYAQFNKKLTVPPRNSLTLQNTHLINIHVCYSLVVYYWMCLHNNSFQGRFPVEEVFF